MTEDEMEEAANIQDSVEEADLEEEEQMSEREAEQDEKMGQKAEEQRLNRMRSKMGKDAEKLEGHEDDEEDMKHIQDNQRITEEGDHAAGIDEEEEGSIDDAKKDIQEEKDLVSDHIDERDEDMGTEKKHEKLEPGKKPQQDFKEKAETKKTTPQKQEPAQKSTQQSQSIAATPDASPKSQAEGSSKSQKSQKAAPKTKMQKDFEALAQQVVSEAHVLEKGDVLETTISLNMEGSLFDGGEVTVKTYRFSPFEVNLDFKKFGHDATGVMKKNSSGLKKVLKENDLTVHQLHIIE